MRNQGENLYKKITKNNKKKKSKLGTYVNIVNKPT